MEDKMQRSVVIYWKCLKFNIPLNGKVSYLYTGHLLSCLGRSFNRDEVLVKVMTSRFVLCEIGLLYYLLILFLRLAGSFWP